MPKHRDWYNAAGERWCSGCQCYLPMPDLLFTKHATSHAGDGLDCYCRLCRKRIARAQYVKRDAERRQRDNEKAARWRREHPALARAVSRRANKRRSMSRRLAAG